jgi:hypothetical protein
MINWKDPKEEMPPSGSHIWVMIRHPRKESLLSCQIIGVEVHETVQKVQYLVNNDDIGYGLLKWDLNLIHAWTEAEEIDIPERK